MAPPPRDRVTADCWGYPGRFWPRCDADGWADELFLYIGDRCPDGAKGECMSNDYWLGEKAERERVASLIEMVADSPNDFRRLIRDIGTAGALRSLAEMIRGGEREATALRFASGRTATAAPATIERETIAAGYDRKSQAAFAHARAHGDGSSSERLWNVGQLYASLAAEVRDGLYAADPVEAPADTWPKSNDEIERTRRERVIVQAGGKRGGKTAASIAAVEDARAAGFSVAVVSPAGVEVRTPSPSIEFVTGRAPSVPDECQAFLNAWHDNTPGDDNGRTLSTACTALERLIADVYGAR